MRIDFTLPFAQPPEVVFPYLADPSTWGDYISGALERTLISDGPVGPGSRWRCLDKVGPLRVEYTDELLELEPDRRVRWRHGPPWNATTEALIEPTDGGSNVTVRFEGRLSGKLRWMDLVPDLLATRVFRRDYERLRTLLGSGVLPK